MFNLITRLTIKDGCSNESQTHRPPALTFAHRISLEITVLQPQTPDLIDLLRQTLEQLERTEDLHPDDPTLIELKRSLVTAIAELKIAKNGRSRAA